jgi:microcystin-dependent protein
MTVYGDIKYNTSVTGTIMSWTDATIPTGFLECDGTAISRTTYSALFNVIGTTYGVGDGSSTFNLPNLQDNVPVGKSGTKSLASTGGANTVSSTGNIGGATANATLSTPQLSSHSHAYNMANPGNSNSRVARGGNVATPSPGNTQNSGSGGGHSHNLSANFTGDANSVLQPYLTLIYIIKT